MEVNPRRSTLATYGGRDVRRQAPLGRPGHLPVRCTLTSCPAQQGRAHVLHHPWCSSGIKMGRVVRVLRHGRHRGHHVRRVPDRGRDTVRHPGKFHVHRKRAALVVACASSCRSRSASCSATSPSSRSPAPRCSGSTRLTFFDEVTNTVLMPVCALFSCIVVGWFITPGRRGRDRGRGHAWPAGSRRLMPS